MADVKALQQERNKLFKDFYNNIVPERMPISFSIRPTMLAEVTGADIVDVQFDYSLLGKSTDQASDLFYTDTCPLGVVGGDVQNSWILSISRISNIRYVFWRVHAASKHFRNG